MRKKSYDKSVYQALAMITQFGINMLVPITILSLLGMYLDEKFGTSYWMIILFTAGAAAGGNNIYRMAKRIYDTKQSSKNNREKYAENNRELKKD